MAYTRLLFIFDVIVFLYGNNHYHLFLLPSKRREHTSYAINWNSTNIQIRRIKAPAHDAPCQWFTGDPRPSS